MFLWLDIKSTHSAIEKQGTREFEKKKKKLKTMRLLVFT